MADYKLTAREEVIRTADGACIPSDILNVDWRTYQGWLAGGGVPDPYVAPPPVVVVDANVRIDAGIAAAVTTVVAAATAIHAIPHSGAVPARFDALLVQMNVLADAFVAMLQAQANPP